MDELAWGLVIARAVPLALWTVIVRTQHRVFERESVTGEARLRRSIVVNLVWGGTFVLFIGGLARVGVVSVDIASFLYTAYGAGVAIVAVVLLWNLWEDA